jgi:hypothetical protein
MRTPTDSSADEEKRLVIGWAHDTIRYCLAVYGSDGKRPQPASPTSALALAHELWDRADAECGAHAAPGHVGLMCARIVLDWCALYRDK